MLLDGVNYIIALMLSARFCIFMLGAVVASFFNCVLVRENRGESWISRPSYCEKCGHKLSLLEKIPVFSCVFAGGRCRHCGKKFGYYHAISEAALGITYMVIFTGTLQSLTEVFIWLFIAHTVYVAIVVRCIKISNGVLNRKKIQKYKYHNR